MTGKEPLYAEAAAEAHGTETGGSHGGRLVRACNGCVLRGANRVHLRLQPAVMPEAEADVPWGTRRRSEDSMGIEYILTGLVALFVAAYLVVALLRPDRF